MASNVGGDGTEQGSPFFPPSAPASTPGPATPTATPKPPTSLKARVAAVAGLDPAHLRAADRSEVRQVLESLLGALKNVSDAELQLGEKHGDGSLRITSHLAVWLISRVTDAYGSRLVQLSKVSDRESLRSISGLADLLTTAIADKQGAVTS